MTDANRYDVIIIGCGPGGSSASTFLARAGKRVLVLEREVFPRFHIGESLLPGCQTIFREMGALPALEQAGFPIKCGAQFVLGNGMAGVRFVFRDGKYNRESDTFQVERALLDHLLLKHARGSGADVREGWLVERFAEEGGGVEVRARAPDGQTHEFTAAFCIDASGRGNVTGNQQGLRIIHPSWKKLAVFGHFTGVGLDPGEAGGDTVIVRLENKWFWIIPVSAEKTSVGLVVDREEFARAGGDPARIFQQWADSSLVVRQRMRDARLVGAMQTTSDFSYTNRRLVGNRLLRVGDAAGFMDPIFSAGVFLATWSGKLAAETLLHALATGRAGGFRFSRYEKRVTRGMRFYWRAVEKFYTVPFMEMFLHPRDHHDVPSAVIAVLAGDIEMPWALRWRLEYFFLLVRIQARWPVLAPRLFFAPVAGMESPPPVTRAKF